MTLENPNPQTRFPQAVAPLLVGDDRYVMMDIGARDGILPTLAPLADLASFIGFEPDIAECERLNAHYRQTGGAAVRIFPHALAGQAGVQRFYITRFPHSSGLLQGREAWTRRFPWTNMDVEREIDIDAITLGQFCAQEKLHHVDFIKLDVEGSEYDVVDGAREMFAPRRVLGLLTECWWDPVSKGQRSFADLDILIRGLSLRFFDLKLHHYCRAVLPAGRLRPASKGKIAPVDRTYGQAWTGDALYFRDPVGELREGALGPLWDASMLLRLCGLLDLYDYGDCAIEILETFRATMLSGHDVDALMDALTPSFDNKVVPYGKYREVSMLVREGENRAFRTPWEPPPTGYGKRK